MRARPVPNRMSYEGYLAFAETAEVKHEYVNGEVYAMTGGSLEHAAIAMQLGAALVQALGGKPCRVFSSDARLRVAATRSNFYPDLSVVCGQAQTPPEDPHSILNPVVLVEVLSDSTEAFDRGAKAAHYRHVPTLKEYVLVSLTERRVEVQRRTDDDLWVLYSFSPGERVVLASVGVEFAVDALFENLPSVESA